MMREIIVKKNIFLKVERELELGKATKLKIKIKIKRGEIKQVYKEVET